MASLKIKDWEAGKLCRSVRFSEIETRELEVELIGKLKDGGRLPPNTFLLRVNVEVECSVQGSPEEFVKQEEMWSRVWKCEVPVKIETVEMETNDLGGVVVKTGPSEPFTPEKKG